MKAPSLWSINTLQGIPTSVHDRVALAGDAAHAMTPHLGSGAGQGIEDAYILAVLLSHPLTTLEALPEVLKIYETVRLPHGNMVQRLSRLNGKLYEFADPRFADLGDKIQIAEGGQLGEDYEKRLKELGDEIVKSWDWAWTTNIDDDKERAVGLLVEKFGNVNAH